MDTQTLEQVAARIDLGEIRKKRINIAIFGHGNVGSHLINQLLQARKNLSQRRGMQLSIFAVANSGSVLLKREGVDEQWEKEKTDHGVACSVAGVIEYAKRHRLDNLIAVDNTASRDFVSNYRRLVSGGFHLIASNKIANTQPLEEYQQLRKTLQAHDREYLYETNVGAGLPLIDTIKLLHRSGENITRIKGVFSGSLSYIFNEFSHASNGKPGGAGEGKSFREVVESAVRKGLTEPDPREDLCGNDVGRKLLILARELDIHCEFDEVSIQNLIPKSLRSVSKEVFLARLDELDVPFHIKRKNLPRGEVLRYVGDLHGDLSKEKGGALLDVKLVSVPKNSMLGQLKGSDSLFEIYTESYGPHPIVIQGAGAGAAVTARGVFGDILRLGSKLN